MAAFCTAEPVHLCVAFLGRGSAKVRAERDGREGQGREAPTWTAGSKKTAGVSNNSCVWSTELCLMLTAALGVGHTSNDCLYSCLAFSTNTVNDDDDDYVSMHRPLGTFIRWRLRQNAKSPHLQVSGSQGGSKCPRSRSRLGSRGLSFIRKGQRSEIPCHPLKRTEGLWILTADRPSTPDPTSYMGLRCPARGVFDSSHAVGSTGQEWQQLSNFSFCVYSRVSGSIHSLITLRPLMNGAIGTAICDVSALGTLGWPQPSFKPVPSLPPGCHFCLTGCPMDENR